MVPAALYGRKINNAEHQLAFIEMLRFIVEGRISPEEAVRLSRCAFAREGDQTAPPTEEDAKLTDQSMSYGGNAMRRATPTVDSVSRAVTSAVTASWPMCRWHAGFCGHDFSAAAL